MHRVPGLGMCYVQSAEFRGALCTESWDRCVLHRVEGSGVNYIPSSGVHYVQSVWFRGALCTECQVLACATYRVQGLGVGYMQSSGGVLCTECATPPPKLPCISLYYLAQL